MEVLQILIRIYIDYDLIKTMNMGFSKLVLVEIHNYSDDYLFGPPEILAFTPYSPDWKSKA